MSNRIYYSWEDVNGYINELSERVNVQEREDEDEGI